jgi:hypothetical protein
MHNHSCKLRAYRQLAFYSIPMPSGATPACLSIAIDRFRSLPEVVPFGVSTLTKPFLLLVFLSYIILTPVPLISIRIFGHKMRWFQ